MSDCGEGDAADIESDIGDEVESTLSSRVGDGDARSITPSFSSDEPTPVEDEVVSDEEPPFPVDVPVPVFVPVPALLPRLPIIGDPVSGLNAGLSAMIAARLFLLDADIGCDVSRFEFGRSRFNEFCEIDTGKIGGVNVGISCVPSGDFSNE
jgi:hypothetical protein